jgi:hypothetical protein
MILLGPAGLRAKLPPSVLPMVPSAMTGAVTRFMPDDRVTDRLAVIAANGNLRGREGP